MMVYHFVSKNLQDFITQNNVESIFEVANNTIDNPGTDSYAYLSSQLGYGEMLGTKQSMNNSTSATTLSTFKGLYESYSATDTRRQFVALGNRNSLGGETNVPLCTKYTNIVTYLENIKVLRLSEMYLSRGEALARLVVISAEPGLIAIARSRTGTALTESPDRRKRKPNHPRASPFFGSAATTFSMSVKAVALSPCA